MNWPDYKSYMLDRYNKFKLSGSIDPEIIELCDLINSFDFVVTTDSCEGHVPLDQELCLTCHRISNYRAYVLAKIDDSVLSKFVQNMKDIAGTISVSYFGCPANGGGAGMKIGFYIDRSHLSIKEGSDKINTFLQEIKSNK